MKMKRTEHVAKSLQCCPLCDTEDMMDVLIVAEGGVKSTKLKMEMFMFCPCSEDVFYEADASDLDESEE